MDCGVNEEDAPVVAPLFASGKFERITFSNITSNEQAIPILFASPFPYYIKGTYLTREQNTAFGHVFKAGNKAGMLNDVRFDEGVLLVSNGELTIDDIAYNSRVPFFSLLDGNMASQMVYNTSPMKNMSVNWSESSMDHVPIINLIEKAILCNDENKTLSLALYGMPQLNYDKIIQPLTRYMTQYKPELGNFIFSGKNGNSDQLIQTLIRNGIPPLGGLKSLGSSMRFVEGAVENLTADDWTLLFQNYNNINFYGNNLGDNIESIVSGLRNRPDSPYFWFDIGQNNIDDKGAALLFQEILACFDKSPPRKGFLFGFGGNPLTDAGVDALANFLIQYSQQYKSSWSQFNFDGSSFTESQWIKIFDALKGADMASISLNRCQFTPNALKSLGELIVASPNAWFINMNSCNIDDDQITAFAQGVTGLTGVPYLYLKENQIGDDGAIALATALKTATVATQYWVILVKNPITSVGANALLAVSSSAGLMVPSFGKNPINVDEIMDSIAHYQANSLCLSGLKMTDDQAVKLAKILETNTTLTRLLIGNNKIGDVGMTAIGAAIGSAGAQSEKTKPEKELYRIVPHESFEGKTPDFSRNDGNSHEYIRVPVRDVLEEKKEEKLSSHCSVQ